MISKCPIRILLIDNYDSYTYNLSHLLASANAGTPPTVVSADDYPSLAALRVDLGDFDAHVVSPGPGNPHSDADVAPLAMEALSGTAATPGLGVCLGHQVLCVAEGAKVVRAPAGPVHGRRSTVVQSAGAQSCPVLSSLPDQFDVVRYHSLAVLPSTLPRNIVPTAWTQDTHPSTGEKFQVLMAVRHAHKPLFGVQFHPESILTEHGRQLAQNFVNFARARRVQTHVAAVPRRFSDPSSSSIALHPGGPPLRPPPLIQREKFIVRHVEIDSVSVDTAAVFSSLFRQSNQAFWLDSSSTAACACQTGSRFVSQQVNSRHSMREEHLNDSASPTRGRLSFMGDASGPLAEIVSYNVKSRSVSVQHSSGRRELIEEITIFEYLKQKLSGRRISPLTSLDRLSIPVNGGYFGFLGYEVKSDVDGVKSNQHTSEVPDAWFLFCDRIIIFDHFACSVHLVGLLHEHATMGDNDAADQWFSNVSRIIRNIAESSEHSCRISSDIMLSCNGPARRPDKKSANAEPVCFRLERSREAYESDICRCLDLIQSGESYEICLTNRIRTTLRPGQKLHALDLYLVLRRINPSPYASYLRLSDDIAVCCSSPERFLNISNGGVVHSKPIKGTRRRGVDTIEDQALSDELRCSVKDRSENLMIVDLVRNDLGRTCQVGSVDVPALMRVETYASVHQLVSTIRGRLCKGMSPIDCIRQAYPMGSMTGAPKIRTMSLIDKLETRARGVYSGSIGYLSLSGAADLNVVIRTAVLNGSLIEIGVGGAVVSMSDPSEEFVETLVKGRALMQAVSIAITGSSEYLLE